MAEDELSGDDEFEVADEVELVRVEWSSSLDDARTVARVLVEHGVGARVEPAVNDEVAGYEVQVLPDEAARATAVLAGEPPDPEAGDGDTAGAAREPVPWRALALLALAALVLVPLVAGLLTFFVFSR